MPNKQYSDLLLNQTKDLIWMVDQNFALVYANKAYLNLMKEVTGVEKKLNTPVLMEGFGEGYMEKWKAYYQRALSGEDFTIEEHFFHQGNNQTQYGHISFSPITDEDGKVNCVACRNTDVTNIVREKYRASSLMDASLDVFCTIDEAGNFIFVSEAATSHWGYTPKELINTPYIKLVLKEDITKTNIIADAVIAGEETTSFTNRYKRKDGGIAYNLWSARWDKDAKLLYCVARDAKEKIEEEQRLKLLSSVITNTNDAVLITEAEPVHEPGPRIVYVNEAFTRMTGYTAEEVIGKTPRILQGPKSNIEELAKLGEALRNWQPYEITTINYKKNGEEFWINFAVTPVADETGWYTHWIAIERDVTAQKNAELEKNLLVQIAACFQEKDLNQAGKALCQIIRDFADFELVELWSPNLERTEFSRIAYDTTLQAFCLENNAISNLPITEGLQGKVWEQKKQFLWNEAEIAENFARKVEAQNEELKHILGVPIIHNKEINDVLVIGTRKDAKQLSKLNDIIQNLETFIGSEINRKRLERDLIRLYDSIPNLVSVGDFHGKFLRINKAGCDLLGYAENEILNQSFEKFIHPDDLDNAFKEMARLQTEDGALEIELRFLTKSGESLWLSWFCNAKVNEGLIYCTAKNITEEKKLETLNKQASSLAKVGSWEYDLIKDDLFWSDEVYHLHDMDPGKFVPNVETAIDFYKEEHKSYVADEIYKSLTEGIYLDYEAIIISKSKKEKWVRVIGSPEFIEGKCVKFIGCFQDTTYRREAERRLQNLSNNIPGVVFQYLIHPDGSDEFKYVSKGSEKIWGYSPEEVTENLDLVWSQVKAGGDFEAVNQSIVDSIENKSKWSKRYRIVRPDGEKRIIQGLGTPEFLGDGTVIFSSVALDITEETKKEELLELATELAQIGSWEVDIEKNTVFWSEEVHRMHETDPKTFVPDLESSIEFYRKDYREMVTQTVELAIKTGKKVEYEAVIVTKNLNERWVKAIGNTEVVGGVTKRFFGSFQDITDRKIIELRLKSLSDDLPGVTFQYRVSPEGEDSRHYTSMAAHKIWGVSPEESERNAEIVWDQIKKGGDFEKVRESIEKSMKSGEKWHFQWRNLHPSGELRWHEGFGTPSYLPDGTIVFNSMIFDITERKRSELELLDINRKLEAQTKELERSNEELESFAFITSHDLQEPLRMISGFMDQLDRKYADQLDDKAKQYIYYAKDGAKRMKQIILDLLLYSRVNRPTEQQESVNLNEIVSDFLLLRRKLIAEKKALINYDQLPVLETYKAPVSQLFHCLLDNALKYNREQVPPIIDVLVVDKGKFWEFAIKDNGIGIDELFYEKVFILFQRLHNRSEYDGTGIGLSIAKRAVEFLGGKIWVESTVGEGSIIYFSIPKM